MVFLQSSFFVSVITELGEAEHLCACVRTDACLHLLSKTLLLSITNSLTPPNSTVCNYAPLLILLA